MSTVAIMPYVVETARKQPLFDIAKASIPPFILENISITSL